MPIHSTAIYALTRQATGRIGTFANGCVTYNTFFTILVPNTPIPPVDLDMDIIFPQDVDQNDTLVLCGLGLLQFELENDWTLNGQPWT
ncbi:MAG: hypothetical protein IPI41_05460 [Flavobacteriales bacterium]|nr:hypothetical protein [Flavobacteriales bacterium]